MILKKIIFISAFLFMFLFNFGFSINETHASTQGYDLNKIKETSENVSLESLGSLAKEYSIPILIVCVVLSGFLALGGIAFKPLKVAAGSLLGIGVLFFILVNYAPEIGGILISIVDGIMERVSGGA